ncbi:MAG: hypothetical protein DRJ96_06740 [Thermoprotei archaeon]|nr:MAG: hypothetical protein DRJ96_06740 [Thermoprotei archaeon]
MIGNFHEWLAEFFLQFFLSYIKKRANAYVIALYLLLAILSKLHRLTSAAASQLALDLATFNSF